MGITFRGDGHYACPEAMTWCEQNGVDYVLGLTGTKPLARKIDGVSDAVRTERAVDNKAVVRGYTETRRKRTQSLHVSSKLLCRA
jgi:Transposase DDE domain group 1